MNIQQTIKENEKLKLAILNARWTRKEDDNHYCNFCHANLNYNDHDEGCILEELSND